MVTGLVRKYRIIISVVFEQHTLVTFGHRFTLADRVDKCIIPAEIALVECDLSHSPEPFIRIVDVAVHRSLEFGDLFKIFLGDMNYR